MTFKEYLIELYNGTPSYVYEMLVSIAALGIVVFLAWKGRKAGKSIARLLSIEYVALFFFSTVLFRQVNAERKYNFTLFWSYSSNDYTDTFMNIMVFIPLGFLLGWTFCKHSFTKTTMIGFFLSVMVESMQFFLKRGFSEIDDVVHNTLGCMIGYGIFLLLKQGYVKMAEVREKNSLQLRDDS